MKLEKIKNIYWGGGGGIVQHDYVGQRDSCDPTLTLPVGKHMSHLQVITRSHHHGVLVHGQLVSVNKDILSEESGPHCNICTASTCMYLCNSWTMKTTAHVFLHPLPYFSSSSHILCAVLYLYCVHERVWVWRHGIFFCRRKLIALRILQLSYRNHLWCVWDRERPGGGYDTAPSSGPAATLSDETTTVTCAEVAAASDSGLDAVGD